MVFVVGVRIPAQLRFFNIQGQGGTPDKSATGSCFVAFQFRLPEQGAYVDCFVMAFINLAVYYPQAISYNM